jgi:hypothetical protein
MKNTFTILLLFLISNQLQAQFIKERSINAQIGLGLSAPYYSNDEVIGNGFFIEGEYVMRVKSWFELKPYAGLILTNSNGKDLNNNPSDEKATSKAFLIGGKARVRAPIRWVAPYIEFGIGASIGTFETFTAFTDIKKNGVVYHIPFSLGLELGRNNGVDLGFMYYYQPTVEQFVGAFAVGITIPLKSNKK